ncbi:alpha/beta fold hydrolase [Motiliproteus coralliicola]|uniref:Alpha/beta fold hydrolase n=1 Tax=Motiliproteus coralliicola TaxID=2283196 RepID=A0A369WX23_9GAMM|nr:alpha/beta fold hydrolase [Motiliproteus coralliicola]RDE25086.1 alpha/beta fold hydrolase [Motiliproteus coralliicola]
MSLCIESLYVEEHGDADKPALVLLHGWGMSSRVWQACLPRLSEHYRLLCVDLPGLGRSTWSDEQPYRLEALADRIQAEIQPRLDRAAIWLGWSLGGVVAAAIAERHPNCVASLVTVATNPCFVQRDDWPAAMAPDTFDAFQASLEAQPAKTLNRFAMLQGQGDPQARALLKQLKPVIADLLEQPGLKLAESLALLAEDYRDLFGRLQCPRLHLFAAEDALVPEAVSREPLLDEHARVMDAVGHVPFLTATGAFVCQLEQWLNAQITEAANG